MSDRGGVVSGGRVPPFPSYLAEIKRQAIPVTVYLVNGFQLRGVVRGFDAFTIVLEYKHMHHLIYKHAVSTITPQASFTAGLEGVTDSSGAARLRQDACRRPRDSGAQDARNAFQSLRSTAWSW